VLPDAPRGTGTKLIGEKKSMKGETILCVAPRDWFAL
jgi:hypothetical protein